MYLLIVEIRGEENIGLFEFVTDKQARTIERRWQGYLQEKKYSYIFRPEGGCCGQSQCLVCSGICDEIKIKSLKPISELEKEFLVKILEIQDNPHFFSSSVLEKLLREDF